MRSLLSHQPNHLHFINLTTNFEFVDLRMQSSKVLTNRVQKTEKQGLLFLNQLSLQTRLSLAHR